MVAPENDTNQSILSQRNPEPLIYDHSDIPIKRKRAQSPPTPCRTPAGDTAVTSPTTTNAAGVVGVTAGDFSDSASISTSIRDEQAVFGYGARIAARSQPAREEGSDDVPPIAFLREQSASVSPARSVHTTTDFPPALHVGPTSFTSAPAENAPTLLISPSTADAPGEEVLTGYTFPFSSSGASILFPQTRAGTSASASEPTPHYQYTYDSLIRRPKAPTGGTNYRNSVYELGGQQDLEAACETTEGPVGVLGGPPALALEGVTALVKGMRLDMDRDAPTRPASGKPSPNTAPTVAYLSLLEETFGPGSVLRGEGAKPTSLGRRRNAGTTSRASPNTTGGRSASASSGVPDGMDVDMDESASRVNVGVEGRTRARGWIAEIEVLVKGKRQLVREDLKSLADTMRDIANMDAAEGRALGEDAPRLRRSLWKLAQLENIPFRDEHKLRGLARKLLKHWPATVT